MAYTTQQLIDMSLTVYDLRTAMQKFYSDFQKLDTSSSGSDVDITSTDELAEGTKNLYFTAQRVRNTAMQGIVFTDATAVTTSDTVLTSVGKLQAQASSYGDTVTYNTGTSGETVPLLSTANTWSETQTFDGGLVGNASTATKLQTARNVNLNGSVKGSVQFDGSQDVLINTEFAEFDSAYATSIGGYPLGAILLLNDGVTDVVSTVANNLTDPNVSMIGWELRQKDSGVLTWSGRTQEEKNKEFRSVCDYGMKGDYDSLNDTAWAEIIASGHRLWFAPEGVYRFSGTINIPNDFILIGMGNPILGFGTADDKIFLVDGSKTNLRGSVFIGSGTPSAYTSSNRSDDYATVNPVCRIYERTTGSTGVRIKDMAIVQDMNCYDTNANAILLEDSNIASNYDVGLYIDDTARGIYQNLTVFGYFSKAGICIQSKEGNDDPDYNTFINCMTTGRHGVALLGADTLEASYGLSGSRFVNTGIYTLDHHSRGTMTDAQRETYYTNMYNNNAKCIFIDGNVNASSAEINGHYFDKCEIRTRFDEILKLDHASNVQFSQSVFEYAAYSTITYSSGTPKFIGTANVKRGVSFLQCRMNYQSMIFNSSFAGLIPVKITIAGDPLNGRMATVGSVGDGTWTIAMLGSDGNIGDASFQLTTDANNGSSGWKMLRKATTDAFQLTKEGVNLLQILPTGAASFSFPSGTDANMGLLGYGGTDSWFLRTQNSSAGQLQFRPTSSGGDIAFQILKNGVISSGLAATTATVGSTSAIYSAMYAVKYMHTSTVGDFYGTGSPEGVLTAGIGSTYRRTDGGTSTTFYVKESGTGNTGWVAK